MEYQKRWIGLKPLFTEDLENGQEKKERSQSYFNASGNPKFISNCRMDYTPSLRSKLGSHVKWSNFFGTGQRLHCHTKYREAKVMPAVGAGQEKHSDIIPNIVP